MAIAKLTKKDLRAAALTASKVISKKLIKHPKTTPDYNIKCIAPAQQAKASVTSLTNILGFHQIPINEFCTLFNESSQHILDMIPIPVIVTKLDKTFTLTLKEPTLDTLISNAVLVTPPEGLELLSEEYYFIPYGLNKCIWFDIIRIKSDLLSASLYNTAKICFGTLASFRLSASIRILPAYIY